MSLRARRSLHIRVAVQRGASNKLFSGPSRSPSQTASPISSNGATVHRENRTHTHTEKLPAKRENYSSTAGAQSRKHDDKLVPIPPASTTSSGYGGSCDAPQANCNGPLASQAAGISSGRNAKERDWLPTTLSACVHCSEALEVELEAKL